MVQALNDKRAELEADLQELREEMEIERLSVQAEHRALAEAQRHAEAIRADYQELYDFGLIGMATFDLRGCIRNINPTGAALLGRPIHRLMDRPLSAVIHPRDHRKWFRYLREVAHQDREVKGEWRVRRPDLSSMVLVLEFTGTVARATAKEDVRIRIAFRDVTQQRLAEEATKVAKEELQFVADNAPVIIARCGRDLRYRFANKACAALLQLPQEQIVGRPVAEVMGAAAFETIRPYVQRVLRGELVEYEVEVPYARAGRHFMHVVYRPEHDTRGRVTGWLAAITDITERKRAEMALRESEARFRQMADSAPVLIWVSGPDKRYTYFNKPWLEFTGRTLKQELRHGWTDGVHPEDLPRCRESHVKAFSRREEFKMEYRLRRHDGEYRWIFVHGVPRFAGKEFLGYIGSCVDITERREAEQVLRETRDVLEERVRERTGELQAEVMIRRHAERISARLAAIVEFSSDAIVSYRLDGKVMSWNRGAERLYGYAADEMLGQPVTKLVPTAQRQGFTHAVRRIRRGKLLEPFETVRLAKGGRRIDVMLRLSPVKDDAGRVTGISHIARDISARKLAEEALRESEARLQAITDNCPALIFLKDPEGATCTSTAGSARSFECASRTWSAKRMPRYFLQSRRPRFARMI